jgi:large subunit ribosomal protein L3
MKFILGKKVKMSQVFLSDGKVAPVTIVEAGPCLITQIKTKEKDGYQAVQIGFGAKRKLTKSLAGHLKDLPNFRYLKEFLLDKVESLQRGQKITVKIFQPKDKVKVTGLSIGKGFQGVVKRHKFHGSPASHGHKDQLRMPGSIGSTDPARVFKGMRMAGRMGGETVTTSNLEIVQIDLEKNYLYIKGAVPGARNGLILVVGPGDLKTEENIQQPVKSEITEGKPEEIKNETK